MQISFSEAEFTGKKKVTRRERFLAELEKLVPWAELTAVIAPYYPKGEGRGRRPIGLERMLRMYLVQQCFGLSDEGCEDALYDSQAIRRFVRIDLSHESAPDATTLLKFRRLLEKHQLTERIFATINAHLAHHGLILKQGTVVDATIMAAPSSTKNREKKRDEAMRQTKKGNQWYFGMKAHVGADAETGVVHHLVTTPANVHDVTQAHALVHGEESDVYADAGYRGVDRRAETQGLKICWHVALRAGKRSALCDETARLAERRKASIRAKVEHAFHIVKNRFGHRKVRYRGLAKNTAQLFTLFALANLFLVKRRLLARHGQIAS